jgi:hypothetical protein
VLPGFTPGQIITLLKDGLPTYLTLFHLVNVWGDQLPLTQTVNEWRRAEKRKLIKERLENGLSPLPNMHTEVAKAKRAANRPSRKPESVDKWRETTQGTETSDASPRWTAHIEGLVGRNKTLPNRVVVSFTRRLAPRRRAGESDPLPTPAERTQWSEEIAERLRRKHEYAWVTAGIVLGVWDEHQVKNGQEPERPGRRRLSHRLEIIDGVLKRHDLTRSSSSISSAVFDGSV